MCQFTVSIGPEWHSISNIWCNLVCRKVQGVLAPMKVYYQCNFLWRSALYNNVIDIMNVLLPHPPYCLPSAHLPYYIYYI